VPLRKRIERANAAHSARSYASPPASRKTSLSRHCGRRDLVEHGADQRS
jgi:hypothetical protein